MIENCKLLENRSKSMGGLLGKSMGTNLNDIETHGFGSGSFLSDPHVLTNNGDVHETFGINAMFFVR